MNDSQVIFLAVLKSFIRSHSLSLCWVFPHFCGRAVPLETFASILAFSQFSVLFWKNDRWEEVGITFFACHGRQVEDGSAMDQANSRKTGTGILSGWEKKHLSMMEDVSKGFARVKPFYPESFEKRLDESVPGVMYRWEGIWVRWEKGTWSRQTWVLWLEVCVCADFKSSLSCVQVGRRDWGKAR